MLTYKLQLMNSVCIMNIFYFNYTYFYYSKAFCTFLLIIQHNIKRYCDIL